MYEMLLGYVSKLDKKRMFLTQEDAEEWDIHKATRLLASAAGQISLREAIKLNPDAAELTAAILFLAEKIKCAKDQTSSGTASTYVSSLSPRS